MKVKIRWVNEYSQTDELDWLGRWARSAIVGSEKVFEGNKVALWTIASIGRGEHDGKVYYYINWFFPSKFPHLHYSIDDAKNAVEEAFNWFMNIVVKESQKSPRTP